MTEPKIVQHCRALLQGTDYSVFKTPLATAKPKHPPVVYVEWTDTASVANHWTDREEALKTAANLMGPVVAAGLLLADEERGIILGLLYTDHNDDVGHVVVIPRSAISVMQTLMPGRGFKLEAV